MSSKEKNQEPVVVMPPSPTEKDVFTVTALRKALDQLSILEHQTEMILMKLFVLSSSSSLSSSSAATATTPVASVAAAPLAVAVTATSGTHATASDDATKNDATNGDATDDNAYGDNDDDDDSGYDGNVQYPYNPQSKIQYDPNSSRGLRTPMRKGGTANSLKI